MKRPDLVLSRNFFFFQSSHEKKNFNISVKRLKKTDWHQMSFPAFSRPLAQKKIFFTRSKTFNVPEKFFFFGHILTFHDFLRHLIKKKKFFSIFLTDFTQVNNLKLWSFCGPIESKFHIRPFPKTINLWHTYKIRCFHSNWHPGGDWRLQ